MDEEKERTIDDDSWRHWTWSRGKSLNRAMTVTVKIERHHLILNDIIALANLAKKGRPPVTAANEQTTSTKPFYESRIVTIANKTTYFHSIWKLWFNFVEWIATKWAVRRSLLSFFRGRHVSFVYQWQCNAPKTMIYQLEEMTRGLNWIASQFPSTKTRSIQWISNNRVGCRLMRSIFIKFVPHSHTCVMLVACYYISLLHPCHSRLRTGSVVIVPLDPYMYWFMAGKKSTKQANTCRTRQGKRRKKKIERTSRTNDFFFWRKITRHTR